MDNNAISTSATVAVAAAGIAGALISVLVFKEQASHARVSLQVSLLLKLDERFDSDGMRRIRVRAATGILRHEPSAVDDVLNFFCTVGLLADRGALDPEMVWGSFYNWIRCYWHAALPYIEEQRKRDPTNWNNLDTLYRKLVDIQMAKYPGGAVTTDADVKEFLESESTLDLAAALSSREPSKTALA